VPVLDVHGRAIAAVGFALPASRLHEGRKETLVDALRAAARDIAAAVQAAEQA
jgi:DNA-binding IclR family transcriptional regulator